VSGFRFAGPDGKFNDVIKKAEYVYWRREYRRSIHGCAVNRFVEDVLKPLGYHYERTIQWVRRRRVEILKVTYERNCVLLILRNWVNPLTNHEIEFLATALHYMTRKLRLRDEYDHIWSFIMCQGLETGQTKLARFAAVNFYKLPYLVSPELLRFFEQKSCINYSIAYPSVSNWSGDVLTELYTKFRRLLNNVQPEDRRLSEPSRARTEGETAPQGRGDLNSNALYDSPTHIVSIMTAPEKTSAGATEGQPSDPPRVRELRPLDPNIKNRQYRIAALHGYAYEGGYSSTDPKLPQLLIRQAMLTWGVTRRTAKEYVEVVLMKMRRAGY
jgi:hypothetical protein